MEIMLQTINEICLSIERMERYREKMVRCFCLAMVAVVVSVCVFSWFIVWRVSDIEYASEVITVDSGDGSGDANCIFGGENLILKGEKNDKED